MIVDSYVELRRRMESEVDKDSGVQCGLCQVACVRYGLRHYLPTAAGLWVKRLATRKM